MKFKYIYRILLNVFSPIISTDSLADKFPVSAKALIFDDNRILILKNDKGDWDLPGGKIENSDKNIEHRLKEEVFEETQLELKIFNLISSSIINYSGTKVLILVFKCEISGTSAVKLSYEHSKFLFADLKSINEYQIPIWIKDALKKIN